ncbi:MAG TPA: hypothetical protein VK421_05970 [Pyrinomonadaceae bacterium]|nr:hypothetical protein [Pyrinomonadaceae bacterium]
MSEQEILEFISAATDVDLCDRIQSAAHKRKRALAQAAFEAKVAEHWKQTVWLKPGDALYCNATGTFLGGPLQRGDKVTVYAVQPKKRVIWLKVGKHTFGFSAIEFYRYKLSRQKPESALGKTERAHAEAAGKVFQEAFR